MEDKKPKLDPSRLTAEERDKLEGWAQTRQMIQSLSDISTTGSYMTYLMGEGKKDARQTVEQLSTSLKDIHKELVAIKDRADPETPDFSKPVVEAVARLEKNLAASINAIDVRPDVKVGAPAVQVASPQVNVDLKRVEDILKNDLPKAFKESIGLIPKVEMPKDSSKWDEVLEWLKSIDTATRMKPLPGSMKVTNADGTPISGGFSGGSQWDYLDVQQTSSVVETYLFKSGGSLGTLKRTIVVTYTDSTKDNIDYVDVVVHT